jgi:heme/copper-type cytochrome/quinol oxidase subunit 2
MSIPSISNCKLLRPNERITQNAYYNVNNSRRTYYNIIIYLILCYVVIVVVAVVGLVIVVVVVVGRRRRDKNNQKLNPSYLYKYCIYFFFIIETLKTHNIKLIFSFSVPTYQVIYDFLNFFLGGGRDPGTPPVNTPLYTTI